MSYPGSDNVDWGVDVSDASSSSSSEAAKPKATEPNKSATAHLYVFTNEKGGMQGYDKDLQQKVIEELSRGSKHLEHAKKSDMRLTKKIGEMKERLRNLDDKAIQKGLKAADLLLEALEKDRQTGRWCAVVDMDMFYAAVEIKDNPKLADIPIAVGGLSMISTTNYVARRYGVRAAMPGFIGEELCKRQGAKLTFVNHHNKRYREEATVVRSVISKYGQYSSYSLDEAEIDMTDAVTQYATTHNISEVDAAGRVLSNLRTDIFNATRLTASGAIGPNFLLAKIGADVNKPNGQFVAPTTPTAIKEWMSNMPIRKIPGVGKVTERFLKEALAIHTVSDVYVKRAIVMCLLDSPKSIFRACLGLSKTKLADYSTVPTEAVKRQSIGAETTFWGESSEQILLTTLAKLCSKVSTDMERNGNLSGKTVVIKVKKTDFQVLTRQTPVPRYIKTDKEIFSYASALLEKEFPISVRLLGVRITKFKNQISYKDARDTSQMRLDSFCKKKNPEPNKEQETESEASVDLLKCDDKDKENTLNINDDESDDDDAHEVTLLDTNSTEEWCQQLQFTGDHPNSHTHTDFIVVDDSVASPPSDDHAEDDDDELIFVKTQQETQKIAEQQVPDDAVCFVQQPTHRVKRSVPPKGSHPFIKRVKSSEEALPVVLSVSTNSSQQSEPRGTVTAPIELD